MKLGLLVIFLTLSGCATTVNVKLPSGSYMEGFMEGCQDYVAKIEESSKNNLAKSNTVCENLLRLRISLETEKR